MIETFKPGTLAKGDPITPFTGQFIPRSTAQPSRKAQIRAGFLKADYLDTICFGKVKFVPVKVAGGRVIQ